MRNARKKSYFISEGIILLLLPLIFLISILPFAILHFLSDFFTFLLFHVIKYRRDVVAKNLSIAFPDKHEAWKNKIAKESYRHFCDILLESIKAITMSRKTMFERLKIKNLEFMDRYNNLDKPVIAVSGHQGNFDWCSFANNVTRREMHALYKPVKNRVLDYLIKKSRKRLGAHLEPMKSFRNYVDELYQRDRNVIICLITDQSPKQPRNHHFTSFFGKPTATFTGFEDIGQEYELPIFYVNIVKTARSYYEIECIEMTNNCAKEQPLAMVDLFYQLLENQIKRQPECYMWTHKRWKITMENTWSVLGLSPKLQQQLNR